MIDTWTLKDINDIMWTFRDKPLDYVSCELTPFIGRFVESVKFFKLSPKKTVCLITFHNGFDVIGESGCINPEHYRQDIGSKYALRVAVDRASPIIAYQEQNLLKAGLCGSVTYDKPE